jgi:hypothetical protein
LKLEWARIAALNSNGQKIGTRKSNGRKIDARKSNGESNNRIWINWFIVSHDQTSLLSPLTCWLFPYFVHPSERAWYWHFQQFCRLPCRIEQFYMVLSSPLSPREILHDFVRPSERTWTLHFWNKKIFYGKGFSKIWNSNGQE